MSEKRKKTPEVSSNTIEFKRQKTTQNKNTITYNGTNIPFPKPKPKQNTYCICRKQDNGDLMVGCDSCDDWYHFHCLKLDPKLQKLYYKFYCPYCELNSVESNVSIFKKKCMLPDCFSPIVKNSKFCCREHGLQYFRNVKSKIPDGSVLIENLRDILPGLKFADFQKLGQTLPDPSCGVMADSFQQFVERNSDYNAELSNLQAMIQTNQVKINYTDFKMHVVNDLILCKNTSINTHMNNILAPQTPAEATVDLGVEPTSKSKKSKKKKSKSSTSAPHKRFEICGFDVGLLTKNQIQWTQYLAETAENCAISADPSDFSHCQIRFDQGEFSAMLSDAVRSTDEISSVEPTICVLEKKKCQRHAGWLKRIQDEHTVTMERLRVAKSSLESRELALRHAIHADFWGSQSSKTIIE